MGIFQWFKVKRRREALKRAMAALRNLDYLMTKQGLSKAERKQFWTEFVKDREVREGTIARIERTAEI